MKLSFGGKLRIQARYLPIRGTFSAHAAAFGDMSQIKAHTVAKYGAIIFQAETVQLIIVWINLF